MNCFRHLLPTPYSRYNVAVLTAAAPPGRRRIVRPLEETEAAWVVEYFGDDYLRLYQFPDERTNPEVAFDLVELSTKLAGEVPPQFLEHMKGKDDKKDDKKDDEEGQKKEASYQSLRALVIRTAAQHPEAREAFLPVLQALKNG